MIVTVFCGPLFAIAGGIIVAWWKGIVVGVSALVSGLIAGLVARFVVGAYVEHEEQVSEARAREVLAQEGKYPDGGKEWPEPIAMIFVLIILFAGAATALVSALVAGWALDD